MIFTEKIYDFNNACNHGYILLKYAKDDQLSDYLQYFK